MNGLLGVVVRFHQQTRHHMEGRWVVALGPALGEKAIREENLRAPDAATAEAALRSGELGALAARVAVGRCVVWVLASRGEVI